VSREKTAAPLLNAIEAFNDGGVEATLPYLDPAIEWRAPPEWLEDRVYEHHDGIRRLGEHWRELFDEYRLEVERVIDLGDGRVVLLLHQLGKISGSTDGVEAPVGYIAEISDGLVTRVDVHFSWEATLEAAGLSA